MKIMLVLIAGLFLILAQPVESYAFNLGVPDVVNNALIDTYSQNKSELVARNYSKIDDEVKKNSAIDTFYIRPTVALPVFKIYKSEKENTKLDVAVNSGIGGGISLVWYKDATDPSSLKTVIKTDGTKETIIDVKAEAAFSFSPFTILMTKSPEEGNINMSWAATAGFFNNTILVGAGYDFGEVADRSRWFGLLSIGATF